MIASNPQETTPPEKHENKSRTPKRRVPSSAYVAASSALWLERMGGRLDNEGSPEKEQSNTGNTAPTALSSIVEDFLSSPEADLFNETKAKSLAKKAGTFIDEGTVRENKSNLLAEQETANPRLVKAWKCAEEMQKTATSQWTRLFHPKKSRVAAKWAKQVTEDLRGNGKFQENERVKTESGKIEDQNTWYSKHPLTTKIKLTQEEKNILSDPPLLEFLAVYALVLGITGSTLSWLSKVAPVTQEEVIIGVLIAFVVLLVIAGKLGEIMVNLKTDSIQTVERYDALVEEEKAALTAAGVGFTRSD